MNEEKIKKLRNQILTVFEKISVKVEKLTIKVDVYYLFIYLSILSPKHIMKIEHDKVDKYKVEADFSIVNMQHAFPIYIFEHAYEPNERIILTFLHEYTNFIMKEFYKK